MIAAECYFLDVGQAGANVIDLRNGSAIIIDCGRSAEVVLRLLDRLGIKRLVAIALTHNHDDHAGGLRRIVQEYRKRIGRVTLLQDADARRLVESKVWKFLMLAAERRYIPEPMRLEWDETRRCLYPIGSMAASNDPAVEIVFPSLRQNTTSLTQSSQNACSAVLCFRCGSRKIVFPGDAHLSVWRAIRDKRNDPLSCDVLAVPHHGGQIVRDRRSVESDEEFYSAIRPDYDRVYTDCIRTQYAVVSAGTANPYDHPIPVHLDALRDAGVKVLCTQITERCHGNLDQLAPAVLHPQSWPGHAKARNSAVACAGTVLVQIGPGEITVDRFEDHRQEVRRKVATPDGNPRCL